jgi:PIN domain nuclease of toxin-antitoxin system
VRLLLDTQILIWQLERRLKRIGRATEAIKASEELLISPISFIEIGIKASVGKLQLPGDLRKHLLESGTRMLDISPEHGLGVSALPLHHRDPFDRVLISQAKWERLTIVTSDRHFQLYDVPVVLAGP